MLLVVGLGNPGTKYSATRHNVGFRFIDLMAKKADIRLNDRRAKAVLGEGHIAGRVLTLIVLLALEGTGPSSEPAAAVCLSGSWHSVRHCAPAAVLAAVLAAASQSIGCRMESGLLHAFPTLSGPPNRVGRSESRSEITQITISSDLRPRCGQLERVGRSAGPGSGSGSRERPGRSVGDADNEINGVDAAL